MDSDKECVNCRTAMPSRARTGDRSQDVAWMVHCKACAALVEDQMALVASRPTEAKIEVYECRTCGTPLSPVLGQAAAPLWKFDLPFTSVGTLVL
jgi:hypothetical protein